MNLVVWQAKYLVSAALILPVSPFLFLQGQYTRRKVGLLPDAAGEKTGIVGDGEGRGEAPCYRRIDRRRSRSSNTSTSACRKICRTVKRRRSASPVRWHVIGRNGVTAKRTIDELVPMIPDEKFDYILVGLGGNDVMKLSSPRKWRRDMMQLLGILRERNPNAVIFITNCPMIKYSPALPHPIKFLLWELSKMHDANIREFTSGHGPRFLLSSADRFQSRWLFR